MTGNLQLTLDWQPPVQLDCLVHSAKSMLLCRHARAMDEGHHLKLHYVAICHLDHEDQVHISDVSDSGCREGLGT